MRIFFRLCLVFAVCLWLVFPGVQALADAYGYTIDVDTMKARESADTFAVRVTQKKVVEEYFDTEYGEYTSDLLAFRVENGSGNTVTGFTLYFVAYDEEAKTRDIVSNTMVTISLGSSPKLNTIDLTGISIAPGDSFETGMAVVYRRFTGVRAMISDYTLEDGTKVTNPAFEEWRNLAYGMISDRSTELD